MISFNDRLRLLEAIDHVQEAARILYGCQSVECVSYADQLDTLLESDDGKIGMVPLSEQPTIGEQVNARVAKLWGES